MIRLLLRRWKQWRCEHFWRPATDMRQMYQVCDYCEKATPVPIEEFYARFGRMPPAAMMGKKGKGPQ